MTRRLPVSVPRLRTLALPLLFALTTVVVTAGHAHAADIDPTGIGDLMPAPGGQVPEGSGTLYETYGNPGLWQLDSDFGDDSDVLAPTMESIADICMALVAALGTACVVIVQWVLRATDVPALRSALASAVGGAAEGLTGTLLPSALAVGALVAFAQHRRGGGGGALSQISWVLVSGVVSVSLLSSPQTWIAGVDSARQIGSTVTVNATSQGLGDGAGDFPFRLDHEPRFDGDARDDGLRKSSDAIWRTYVATPWCVAEFGSFEVCEEHGSGLLEVGPDPEKRREWLEAHVNDETVGADSAEWRQGGNPVGRIMVALPALASTALFTALVLALAFASLASLIGALLLLLAGVLFACLWVIPGRPRQWGLAWFDQLLARTLESLVATMVLGAVLSVQTAATQLFGAYGWLPTVGVGIAAAVVGVRFRSVLARIFGVRGTMGGAVGGLLAAKVLDRTAAGLRTARGARPRGGARGTPAARATGPAGPPRVPRQRPPAPPPRPSAVAGARTGGTATDTGPGPVRPAVGFSRPAGPGRAPRRRVAVPARRVSAPKTLDGR